MGFPVLALQKVPSKQKLFLPVTKRVTRSAIYLLPEDGKGRFNRSNQEIRTMAKYYVQSGTMRSVVEAESCRKAALWAVHQAMLQVLPIEDEGGQSPETKSERAATSGVSVLSGRVNVSERGFDRGDAASLPTLEVVTQWNQMVTTLDRLERMLHGAA